MEGRPLDKKGVLLNLDKKQLDNLDLLVKYAGKSRSEVLRGLIPTSSMVAAMEEMLKKTNRPAPHMTKLLRLSFIEAINKRLKMEYQGKENPFALQIAVIGRAVGQGPDSTKLFIARCRAERGVPGYEIKTLQFKVPHQDKIRDEFAITGPGIFDTEESLCRLCSEMYEFLQEYSI